MSITSTTISLKLCGAQVHKDRKIEKIRYVRGEEAIRMDGDHRGLVINVIHGDAWITQVGDPSDHIVPKGGSFRSGRKGRVVIQGFGDSEICIGG